MYALNDPRCVLLEGNTFALLPALPDNFAGLIVTDPPYGARTHSKFAKERRADGAQARTDLEFAHLGREQVEQLAAEYARLSQGWIVVFTDDRSVGWWGESLESFGAQWIRTCSWIKTNPMPQLTMDRPGTGEEFIVLAHTRRRPPVWNGRTRPGTFRGPRDLDGFHPNQKPLWLMQELVHLFATPGELVLDPFAGSGSTGVATLYPSIVHGLTDVTTVGCPKCQKAHSGFLDGRATIVPDLKFVGIEGAAPTVTVAKARLEAALKGDLYDPPSETVSADPGK